MQQKSWFLAVFSSSDFDSIVGTARMWLDSEISTSEAAPTGTEAGRCRRSGGISMWMGLS